MNREDQTLTLSGGRKLGFAEYGSGTPLLYFHGHPCSRLEARYLAGREGIRVIGIDRPGMGLSSYQPKRTLISWTDDVVSLADSLGLEKFAVVGLSGGAPYALACAYAIPERISACGIVSGVWSIDRRTAFLAAWMPWVMPNLRTLAANGPRMPQSAMSCGTGVVPGVAHDGQTGWRGVSVRSCR